MVISGTGQSVRDSARRLLATPPRSDARELMDAPGLDPDELAGNLRDIRRVNRHLGGAAVVLRRLPELIGPPDPGRRITILDLATGSADIPLAVAAWARRRNVDLRIVASDISEEMLAEARRQLGGHPDITLARYDARSVPLPDGAFDIVLCSLSLHHLPPDDAVLVLGEMHRLARRGFILNDLRRSRAGYLAALAAAKATTRNRLTRNDAPLSVLRAYTSAELRELLHQAGIDYARIATDRWFRMSATVVKPDAVPHA
jgi:ubiquinone/menaquinone biosynthesis C-methylase UbiE